MTRSLMKRCIAISSVVAFLVVVAFLAWRNTRPLQHTHRQAFFFEAHPNTLQIDAKRPVVASTATGGLYLLTAEKTALTLRMSHDSGDHWMAPATLSAPASAVTTSAENAPQLATHGMYAFALWQQKSESAGTQLMEARATGMGGSATATPVTDKHPSDKTYSGFATLAVAPNGDVYVAWLDGRDNTSASTGTFNVYLARSTDHGLTFDRNVKVATLACPCCRPSVAVADDGTVYVAYRHVYPENERDIAVATSTDHGEHFGEPVRVAEDRWKLYGCPESGPVTAVQGNKLIVAWYTAAHGRPGIRVAASRNRGKNFSKELALSRGIDNANHPYLSMADDGTVAILFSGRRSTQRADWGNITPYALRIDTKGHVSAASPVAPDVSGVRYPTGSLSSDGSLYVAWNTPGASTVTLVRGTIR